ncbi:M48 family metallopeptidase [Clostridium fungisolvens]|uniref:Protease HtpX n=1 Tax=Clostridium fungisolvens TaxID=1604897 RepID=A0A6V8SD63_9CLOT|nr:M48 family metallopeptidase [Clostridium fungisolvens]GFP75184.1 Protease HtpX [Clostridium fungisolvens]
MKKFLLNTIIICVFLFFITCILTFATELSVKSQLKASNKVEYKVSDNKVQVPNSSERAIANYQFSKVFLVVRLIITFLIPALFIYLGAIRLANEFKGNEFLRLIKLTSLYLFFDLFLSIPLSFFSSFYRLKLIGISNSTFSLWGENYIKSFALNFIITVVFVIIPYIIFIKFKRWYIVLGLLTVPVGFVGSILAPVFIDPLFNDFKPIQNVQVKQEILSLAKKANIGDVTILEVDKSKETKALNAYMSGIFNTKRIVIWDNTLNQLSSEEIQSVVAHEIGHYKLNHIPKSIALSGILSIILLGLTDLISKRIVMKVGFFKNNIVNYKSLAAVPILILIFTILSTLSDPLTNWYSRKIEMDADKFAIELTHDNLTNAKLEARFMETNLSMNDVNPLYKFWVYDHPTPKERIEMSNDYKPWETGDYRFDKIINEK